MTPDQLVDWLWPARVRWSADRRPRRRWVRDETKASGWRLEGYDDCLACGQEHRTYMAGWAPRAPGWAYYLCRACAEPLQLLRRLVMALEMPYRRYGLSEDLMRAYVLEEQDYDDPRRWTVRAYDEETGQDILRFDIQAESEDVLTPELIYFVWELCERTAQARGYDYAVDASGEPLHLPDTNEDL